MTQHNISVPSCVYSNICYKMASTTLIIADVMKEHVSYIRWQGLTEYRFVTNQVHVTLHMSDYDRVILMWIYSMCQCIYLFIRHAFLIKLSRCTYIIYLWLMNKNIGEGVIYFFRGKSLLRYNFDDDINELQNTWNFRDIWFSLVSLFNGISTFVGYLMPKPFSKKNSSSII